MICSAACFLQVDVQEFPDIKSGFSVNFKFSPDNPHFTNRCELELRRVFGMLNSRRLAGNDAKILHCFPCAVLCFGLHLINQSKCKTSYAKRSLKTKQHTAPDELESHNPMPANHMPTPHTGKPQAT